MGQLQGESLKVGFDNYLRQKFDELKMNLNNGNFIWEKAYECTYQP